MPTITHILHDLKTHEEVTDLLKPALNALEFTQQTVRGALSNVNSLEGEQGIIFHTLQNLLSRIEEQAVGMLTCFDAGCPSAAETLARTVVETSVNFIYIASGNHTKRIFSYFRNYFREHEKRLSEWDDFVNRNFPHEDAVKIKKMIEGRQISVANIKSFIEEIACDVGLPDAPTSYDWEPKLFERFKATGEVFSYWTVYHRLSAASHGNAEETIRWLLALYPVLAHDDHGKMREIATETLNYTALMLRISLRFYVNAAICMCIIHAQLEAANKLKQVLDSLEKSVLQIADAAGCPRAD